MKNEAESWNQRVLSKSSRWTLVFQKANQTIPDMLSGKELAALLTPALLNHACSPQGPPLHHSNSLQLQFMPFLPYSGFIREHKHLVSILSIITHWMMKVVTKSPSNNVSPGLTAQTCLLGNWQSWQVEKMQSNIFTPSKKPGQKNCFRNGCNHQLILQLIFCNCFKSEAHSIMARYHSLCNLDLALSKFEVIKSRNPRWKKKSLDRGQQDIWSKAHVSEIRHES